LLSIFELICDATGACVKKSKMRRVSDRLETNLTQNRHFKTAYKTLWSIAILLSMCGLTFYIHGIYRKWYIVPDIMTTVKKVSSSQIPLPAITICSSIFPEQIQMSRGPLSMMNNAILGKAYPKLTVEQQNYMAVVMQTCCTKQFIIGARMICTNQSETNVVKLLNAAKTMSRFKSCLFRDKTIDCDRMVRPALTEHGICHTFNMQQYGAVFNEGSLSEDFEIFRSEAGPSLTTNSSDQDQWTLENGYKNQNDEIYPIRANKRNTVAFEKINEKIRKYCAAMGEGCKLTVHLPNEIPTIFHKPLYVDMMVSKHFEISAKILKTSSVMHGYRPEVRRCYFEGERKLKFFRSYTKTLCDFECMTNYTMQQCGCVKFNMPRENDTKVCDLDRLDCSFDAVTSWTSNTDCNCLQPCTDIEYTISLKKEINDREEQSGLLVSHFDFMFAKHAIEEHTSYVAYTIQNFVADCGGLIGLFLGFSLLSIFELVCNLITFATRKWKKPKQQEMPEPILVQSYQTNPTILR
jgi:amiloride-sensitive sodium channel